MQGQHSRDLEALRDDFAKHRSEIEVLRSQHRGEVEALCDLLKSDVTAVQGRLGQQGDALEAHERLQQEAKAEQAGARRAIQLLRDELLQQQVDALERLRSQDIEAVRQHLTFVELMERQHSCDLEGLRYELREHIKAAN